jgi:hypothetical protein
MRDYKALAAVGAVFLLAAGLWRPADAAAPDKCDDLIAQFVHSYSDKTELSFTGTMGQIGSESGPAKFFVDYGCGNARVEYRGPLKCADGARVTVVGTVLDVDMFDEVEARQVICASK